MSLCLSSYCCSWLFIGFSLYFLGLSPTTPVTLVSYFIYLHLCGDVYIMSGAFPGLFERCFFRGALLRGRKNTAKTTEFNPYMGKPKGGFQPLEPHRQNRPCGGTIDRVQLPGCILLNVYMTRCSTIVGCTHIQG